MKADTAKALAREYFRRLLNEKDLSACDELLSPDYIDHDAPPDTSPGPSCIKEFVTKFIQDYPDIHVSIEDILAEGQKVAARLIWQGIHRETGKKFHQMGIVILQFNDTGQLTERWSAYTIVP